MKYSTEEIRNILSDKGLKVTPQRIAILDAIYKLEGHPSADSIIEYIRKNNPNIATGTVYKALDTFLENKLIKKITTDRDIMRYDGVLENHHHLYCSECDIIENYVDEELDTLLNEYFRKIRIKGFHLKEFTVQIRGTFDNC